MLLEFKVKNYKSFLEEATFSMIPAPKQKGLDYSILEEKIKGKKIKGLCSSVIYGPNAAGKTNIIGAMEVFCKIVARGNIRDGEPTQKKYENAASTKLDLIPNNKLTNPQPVDFSVDFCEDDIRVQYSISADLGMFCENVNPRRIIKEELTVNGNMIFCRKDRVEFGDLIGTIGDYLIKTTKNQFDTNFELAQEGLEPEELFLTNGFKHTVSKSLSNFISNWFHNKFIIFFGTDSMIASVETFSLKDKKPLFVSAESHIDDLAKSLGVKSNLIGYVLKDGDLSPKLYSIFPETSLAIPISDMESRGTIRLIDIFPVLVYAIKRGATLIIDELDTSIHPMVIMNIINIFHNDDINIYHAQLVFNTHNPIFLNSNLFRRDEIKFVERNDNTDYSTIYSLADFKTSGKKGVRKGADYMRNYFVSQYGAIKSVDLTPIFEKIIENKSET